MTDFDGYPAMVELQNIKGGFDGYEGPIMLPAEKIQSFQKVLLTMLVGENFWGPQYTHVEALEVKLVHGEHVYAANSAVNRILLAINQLDDEENA